MGVSWTSQSTLLTKKGFTCSLHSTGNDFSYTQYFSDYRNKENLVSLYKESTSWPTFFLLNYKATNWCGNSKADALSLSFKEGTIGVLYIVGGSLKIHLQCKATVKCNQVISMHILLASFMWTAEIKNRITLIYGIALIKSYNFFNLDSTAVISMIMRGCGTVQICYFCAGNANKKDC